MDTPTNPLFLINTTWSGKHPLPYNRTSTEPQTGTQGHAALNVPTPSLLEEITPQCTESNARPMKRTAHGNRSRTELSQTQNSLATTVEGPPLSPQTEPRAHNATHKGYPTKQKITTTL
jgi:hypothetical protein